MISKITTKYGYIQYDDNPSESLGMPEYEGKIILENIEIKKEFRGKGKASELMIQFINKFSDKIIELCACAQDDDTDTDRLVEFYESFGFINNGGDDWIGYDMSL